MTMAPPLQITLDERDELQVSGDAPGSLLTLLITDDIGFDLDLCDELLADVAAVQRGEQPGFTRAWNATRLEVDAAGARLTFAMNLASNPPRELAFAELLDALAKLRAAIAG